MNIKHTKGQKLRWQKPVLSVSFLEEIQVKLRDGQMMNGQHIPPALIDSLDDSCFENLLLKPDLISYYAPGAPASSIKRSYFFKKGRKIVFSAYYG
jgi:hypothetical protein